MCRRVGHGQLAGGTIPYGFISRATAAFDAVFRKAQDATFKRLHGLQAAGSLKEFVLPYLGQQDAALPCPGQIWFPDRRCTAILLHLSHAA